MKISIASSFLKLLCAVMLLGTVVSNSIAAEQLPDIELIVPEQQVDREYLGLTGASGEKFTLADIKADLLVVELFSMYCPFCQEEAPRVNELYERLQELEEHRGIVVRMIGLGASNSAYEVEHFKKTYQVKFPMFPDKDLSMYDKFKGGGTPEFIGCVLKPAGESLIVLRNSGGFDSAAEFMNELITKGGY